MRTTYHILVGLLLVLVCGVSPAAQPSPFTVAPVDEVAPVSVSADSVSAFTVDLSEAQSGCSPNDGALPISLPDFSAKRLDPLFVELAWSAFQTYEGNQWYLERRYEYLPGFISVRELPERIMTGGEYIDPNSYTGRTYYRLHGISAEGEKVYTRIAVVGNTSATGDLTIYPNPVSQRATVTLPGGGGAATVTVIDGLGRVVRRYSVRAGETDSVSLEAENLAPGAYQLIWRGAKGEAQVLRFVKK